MLTGLMSFELKSTHDEVSTKFVLNLPITGLDKEARAKAILQEIIVDPAGFFHYLRLLLRDETISLFSQKIAGNESARWKIFHDKL